MKIVFVSSSRNVWGAESSMRQLALDLSDRLGYDVRMITGSTRLASEFAKSEFVQTASKNVRLSRWRDVISYLRVMRKQGPDCSFIIFNLDLMPLVPIMRLTGARCTFVLDLHNYNRTFKAKVLFRSLVRAFDGVLAVSNFVLAQVPESGATGRVVYRGIVPPTRSHVSAPNEDKCLTIGVIGRVDPDKKIEYAVASIELAKQEHVLRVRGDWSAEHGEYAEGLIARGERMLGSRFVYDGRVDYDSLYDGIDVLLFLNPEEPSGRVIAEAQSAGLVVIVPDRGGASEFVEDRVTGFKVDTRDSKALARTLDDLARSKDLLRKIGDSARVRALARYDPIHQAREYAECLESIHSASCSPQMISWERGHGRVEDLSACLGLNIRYVFPERVPGRMGILQRYCESLVITILYAARRRPRYTIIQLPPPVAALSVAFRRPGSRYVFDAHSGLISDRRWRRLNRLLSYSVRKRDIVLAHNAYDVLGLTRLARWKPVVLQDPILTAESSRHGNALTHESKGQATEVAPLVVVPASGDTDEPLDTLFSALSTVAAEFGAFIVVTGSRAAQSPSSRHHSGITFSGFLPEARYRELLTKAHVVLTVTTRGDILQRGALESLLFGARPVLAESRAMRDILEDTGVFYQDPRDANGIVQAVARGLELGRPTAAEYSRLVSRVRSQESTQLDNLRAFLG